MDADQKRKILIYSAVFILLLAAFITGRTRTGPEIEAHIREIVPHAAEIETDDGLYSLLSEDGALIGWASTGTAAGYGGPLTVLVCIDTSAQLTGAKIVDQKESPLFMRMAKPDDYFSGVSGSAVTDINYNYSEVVGLTGATRSADAIIESVRKAVAETATAKLNIAVEIPEKPVGFGLPEIAVILLFLFAVIGHYQKGRTAAFLRWSTILFGIVIIGFHENAQITLAKLTSFLSGYLPGISTGLYWYLIIGGFILTVLIYGKSLYCSHICPFGGVQDCIGTIGIKNAKLPSWSVRLLSRIRNGIVFSAITIALVTAQPAKTSYEPFAAVFALQGTVTQWILLFVVLASSLIIRRPWCYFFCPVRPFETVLKTFRSWTTAIWKK